MWNVSAAPTSEASGDGPAPPGTSYATFIRELVAEQDVRKASLEGRGLAVITTAGSLATALFGLVALITKSDEFVLPGEAHGPLGVAVAAFTIAAMLGVLTNLPLFYKGVAGDAPKALLDERWDETEDAARLRIASTRAGVFEAARKANGLKAWLLILAMVAEVVGVGAIGLAVIEVLRSA